MSSSNVVDTTTMNALQLKEYIESHNVSTFHQKGKTNADGTPKRWRRNGAIKVFKRDPMRITIPLKHGLYAYDKIESVDDFNRFLVIPA